MKTKTQSNPNALRVHSLHVRNVMRVQHADVEPDPNIVPVVGPNGSGKSSLLQALTIALQGAKAAPDQPIRQGAKKGEIEADLGEYKVRVSITEGGVYLKLYDVDGNEVKSAQKTLDGLYNGLTCDPMAFLAQKPKDQAATLMRLAGLDFTRADELRKKTFDERTIVNREVDRLTSVVSSFPASFPKDLPADEQSAAALLEEIRGMQAAQAEYDAKRTQQNHWRNEVDRIRAALQDAEKKLSEVDAWIEQATKVPTIEQINAKSAAVTNVEQTNASIRQRKGKADAVAKLTAAQDQADGLTSKLQEIDARKAKMLAESKLPVDGLTFDDTGVMLGGVPLSQASRAQQIRVSVAVALAMNPRIRTVLVRDASLLDADSRKLLADAAIEQDAQLWLEYVESDEPGIYMADGIATQTT